MLRSGLVLLAAAMTVAAPRAEAADIPGSATSAATIAVDAPRTAGAFEVADDSDWYRIQLEPDGYYAIAGYGNGDQAIATIALRDADGSIIAAVASGGDAVQGFSFRARRGGLYFLEAAGDPFEPAEVADYLLEVTKDLPPGWRTPAELTRDEWFSDDWEYDDDRDWVRFAMLAGQRYRIVLDAGYLNGRLRLFGPDRTLLAEGAPVPTADGVYALTYTAPQNGTFYVVARAASDTRGPYRLRARLEATP